MPHLEFCYLLTQYSVDIILHPTFTISGLLTEKITAYYSQIELLKDDAGLIHKVHQIPPKKGAQNTSAHYSVE